MTHTTSHPSATQPGPGEKRAELILAGGTSVHVLMTAPAWAHADAPLRELVIADGTAPEIVGLLEGALVPAFALGRHESAAEVLRSITTLLAGERLDTLHIVAHGRPGAFCIGGQWIDADALRQSAALAAGWPAAEVALWSCEAGADAEFVAALSRAAGAPVFAASGLVGHGDLDGTWSLAGSGHDAPFLPHTLAAWPFVLGLAAPTPSDANWLTLSRPNDPNGGSNGIDGSWTAAAPDLVGSAGTPYLQYQVVGGQIFFKLRVETGAASLGVPAANTILDLDGDGIPEFSLTIKVTEGTGGNSFGGAANVTGGLVDPTKYSYALSFNPMDAGAGATANVSPSTTAIATGNGETFRIYDSAADNHATTASTTTLTTATGNANNASMAIFWDAAYDLDADGRQEVYVVTGFDLAAYTNFASYTTTRAALVASTYETLEATWPAGSFNGVTVSATQPNSVNGDIGGGAWTGNESWATIFGVVDVNVSNPTVNEASPHAVFTVTGLNGATVSLGLADVLATGGSTSPADGSVDYGSAALQYSLDNGTTWIDYTTAFSAALTGGASALLVRTTVVNDTANDNNETFRLTVTPTGSAAATGTATIKDDGTGDIFKADGTVDASAARDNDIAVSSPSVNEASEYAVFSVAVTSGQELTLGLAALTATGGTTTPTNGSVDYGSTALQYSLDNGTTWTSYSTNFNATLTGGATALLVRTTVVNDTVADNGETFRLSVTPTGGTAATGTATIKDDGTGDIFKNDGTVDEGAARNNDITVTSPTVNEASPYAVFSVGVTSGQNLALGLGGGSASGGTTTPTDGSVDYGSTALQYSLDNGTTWTSYTTAFNATLTGGATALLVRTTVVNDTATDNNETFQLTVTPTGGSATTGTATIKDDGTGDIFKNDGALDAGAAKNNDAGVSNVVVNEASPYAVFSAHVTSGQNLSLALADLSATGGSTTPTDGSVDYGSAALQYSLDNGANWITYTTAFDATLTGGATTLLVRTTIVNDTVADNNQAFQLTVTPTGGTAATGTATIKDDGTGDIFKNDGTIDAAAARNNDITVSSPTVNEASPYAVFSVGVTSGQNLALGLGGGSATGGITTPTDGSVDYGSTALQYSLDNGTTWTGYTTAFNATLTGGATALLVRTTVVEDSVVDNGETFVLTVTPNGGTAVTGTCTINDQGAGVIFNGDGSQNGSAAKTTDTAPPPPPPPPPPAPPPAPAPAPAPAPVISADVDPNTDTGDFDRVTQNIEPEFTINAGALLVLGGAARLLDPNGNVVGTSPVTAADIASGTINVAPGTLDDGTYTYTAQVLDASGKVVGTVPVVVTVVTDRDGVMPSVELAANNGDFNHDGILDWQQNNVAQLPLASLADFSAGKAAPQSSFGAIMAGNVDPLKAGAPVALDNGAQLVDISASPLPAALPQGFTAVSPNLNFTVTSAANGSLADIDPGRAGLQTRVVIDLQPGGVIANTFLKFNAGTGQWFQFLDDGKLETLDDGATLLDLNGDGRIDRVVVTLTDGGAGDADGVANGTIVDPGVLALAPAKPVYSVLLSTGDRFYTVDAAEAAAKAHGTGNLFEGARFDNLDAAAGGLQRDAYYNPYTGDWYFAAAGQPMPYACYTKVQGAGFKAAAPGLGGGSDFHLFLNGSGITQLATAQEATALGLAQKGYADKGVVFNTTTQDAFVFDVEGYLIANHDNANVQALVNSLKSQFTSTSAAGFVEAVEMNYLEQVSLVGVAHGGTATAADLNAAFGTNFTA